MCVCKRYVLSWEVFMCQVCAKSMFDSLKERRANPNGVPTGLSYICRILSCAITLPSRLASVHIYILSWMRIGFLGKTPVRRVRQPTARPLAARARWDVLHSVDLAAVATALFHALQIRRGAAAVVCERAQPD